MTGPALISSGSIAFIGGVVLALALLGCIAGWLYDREMRRNERARRPRYRVTYAGGRHWPERREWFGWRAIDGSNYYTSPDAIRHVQRAIERRQPQQVVATFDASGNAITSREIPE